MVMTKTPIFPQSDAFLGRFDLFWQTYGDKCEICPAYHFASALAQTSVALGRKVKIAINGEHYPNFYQAILGPTHLAAKSPIRERTANAMSVFHEVEPSSSRPSGDWMDCPDRVQMFKAVNSVGSVEGLREMLSTHECSNGKESPMDWYKEANGVRLFLHIDELGSLLGKSQQKATQNITQELTQLYNPSRHPVRNPTRGNPTRADNPVINIFGCTTLEWFEKFLDLDQVLGGFTNRFVFYRHEQQPLKPIFDEPDWGAYAKWRNMLRCIAADSLESEVRKFTFDASVLADWESWYVSIKTPLVENPDSIESKANVRVTTHAIKLALVYAAVNNNPDDYEVHMDAWNAAKAVAKYWAEVAGLTFQDIDFDRRTKIEQKILKALDALGGKVPRRKLQRKIGNKFCSAEELNRSLDALYASQQIEIDEVDNPRGRPTQFVVLTTEGE